MDYRDTSFPVIHSYLKMQRYFIYLSFNGAQYHGWQIQPNGITVQEVLEKALATLLRRETPVTGAGRTDAGVPLRRSNTPRQSDRNGRQTQSYSAARHSCLRNTSRHCRSTQSIRCFESHLQILHNRSQITIYRILRLPLSGKSRL